MSFVYFLPFLVISLIAQWGDRHRPIRWATYGLLVVLNGGFLLLGLGSLLLSLSEPAAAQMALIMPGLVASRWAGFGWVTVGSAMLSLVVLLPCVRRWIARLIPIDAQSSVHATALALAALMTGLNLAQVELIGGLAVLADAGGSIGVAELLTSNLPIGVFAIIGVGYLVRRDGRRTLERLGLERITWRQVGLVLILTLVILVTYYGIDKVWLAVDPESYAMLESINEALFGGVDKLWQAMLLGLSAAVTEELLFRGALQPRFGFFLTAILFGLAHVQYGWTLATLEVFVAGLVLGWLRERGNTSACILLHLLYDVLALTVFSLLP